MIRNRLNPKLRGRLIEEVKALPELYDLNHPHYKDTNHRDQAWLRIAEKFGENFETVRHEWKIMRDSYRQALRRRAVDKTGKIWMFEKKMEFLMPNMSKRENTRRIVNIKSRSETLEPQDHNASTYDEQNDDDKETEATDFKSLLNASQSVFSEDDGLDMFYASVCQSTKRLPKALQRQVKRNVLDVLLKAEEMLEREESV